MKKANMFTKRVVAILLSSMLAVGTIPGTALAEEVQENTVQEEEEITTYTITLDANGGYFENEWDDVLGETVESSEVLNKNIPIGEAVTTFPVKKKENSAVTFMGWSFERDGEIISQGYEEYVPLENCVLFAAWNVEDSELTVEEDRWEDTDNQDTESGDEGTNQAEELEIEADKLSENTDAEVDKNETTDNQDAIPEEADSYENDHKDDKDKADTSEDEEEIMPDEQAEETSTAVESTDIRADSNMAESINTDSQNAETTLKVEYNGHYYQRFDELKTWTEAKEYCESIGGHLVTITSPDEQSFIETMCPPTKFNCWIGGTDEENEGVWQWITGEVWSYTNWEEYQPDNCQSSSQLPEDYLQLCADYGYQWNDAFDIQDREGTLSFICEWEYIESDNQDFFSYGVCGENLFWKVISDEELYKKYAPSSWKIYPTNMDDRKILIITGSGNMYDYESASSVPWKNMDIDIVIIENGVTSIGNHAFDGVHFINEIELPETITYIGEYSFAVDAPILGNLSIRERHIIIPSHVNFIGNHFIENCNQYSEILFERGSSPESFCDDCFAGAQATVYFPYDEYPWINLYTHPDLYQYGSPTTSSIHWYPWSGDLSSPEKEGRKSGVLGELLAVDTDDRSIKVDGTKLYVSPDVDLETLSELHADYLNSKDEMIVICKRNFDFAEDVELVGNVIEGKITVRCSDPSLITGTSSYAFVYSGGRYTASDTSLSITVHYGLKDNDYYSEKDFPNLVKKPLQVNNLEMVFGSGNNNLIKEFSNSLSGKISIADSLSIPYGESKTVQTTLHPQSVPASINDQLTVTVSGEKANGGTIKGSGSIRFYNEDLQVQQASKRTQNTPKVVNSSAAKTALQSCSTVRTSDFPNLMGILDSSQKEAVQSCVNLWIAEMIIAKKCDTDKDYFNSIINGALKGKAASKGISISELLKVDGWADKVQEKLLSKVLSKMGLSEECFLVPEKKTGSITIDVDSKYGPCILKFDLDLALYGLGKNPDPFAAFGTLTCTVNGFTEDQIGTFRTVDSPVTFTNTTALCNAMKNLLMSSIETAYSEAYGKDADKAAGMIADMIVNYPVSTLLSEYGVSLSGSTYRIAMQSAEYSYKNSRFSKTTVRCPVDIYIYDNVGNLCGAIVNNTVDSSYNELGMYVDGDEKTVYLAGDDYRIKYVGNDVGLMDVDITYYIDGQSEDRILRFEDVPIEKDQVYESYVPDSSAFDSDIYAIREGGGDLYVDNVVEIIPVYDSLQEKPTAIGVVIDQANATCNIGSTIQLKADVVPLNANSVFLNWASDNEDVAIVTQAGTVTGVGFGSANIIVSSNAGSFTTACRVVVGKLDSEDESLLDAGTCGDAITWKLNEKGTLTVSGAGDLLGYSFGDSGDDKVPEYARNNEIKKLIIENGVTGIGEFAFCHCENLKEVYIPESVKVIRQNAFTSTKIEEVTIPGEEVQLNMFAFQNCKNLKKVFLNSAVTDGLGGAFYHCDNLVDATIQKGIVGNFFMYCDALSNLTLGNEVTKIGNRAFGGMKGLKNIDIPDNITEIEYETFSNCENLEVVTIGKSVKIIGSSAFYNCTSLKKIEIPDNVITIRDCAFLNCSKLSEIQIGKGVTDIGGRAFGYCSSLNKISLIGSAPNISYDCFINDSATAYYPAADTTWTDSVRQNYGGNITWVKVKGNLAEYEVSISDSGCVYTGAEQKPAVIVKNGSVSLNMNSDYSVSYENNVNAGTADITITGIGNYEGTIKESFTIRKASLSSATVIGLSSKTYTGKAITQTPIVKMGSTTLKLNTDYIASYENNTNVGTATVTITGKGNYTGSVSDTFTITKASQNFFVKATSSTIDIRMTTTVTASGAKEKPKFSFTSSNTKVATVDSAGNVTGKSAGTVTITVRAAETKNYNAASKTIKITVTASKSLKKPGNCHFAKWNNSKYTSCRIAWNKVDGAEGYETLLSWTNGSHASRTIVKSNVLYRDCTVHPQHVSQMMVRAFYMSGGKRVYSPWSNVEYITPSPTKLTTKNASSGTNLKMNISWNIIYGCNGYNVFLATNPNSTWYWNQSTSTKADATSAVITKYRGSKLKKNTRYYVRIVTRRKRNGVFCTVPMPASNTYIGSFIIK